MTFRLQKLEKIGCKASGNTLQQPILFFRFDFFGFSVLKIGFKHTSNRFCRFRFWHFVAPIQNPELSKPLFVNCSSLNCWFDIRNVPNACKQFLWTYFPQTCFHYLLLHATNNLYLRNQAYDWLMSIFEKSFWFLLKSNLNLSKVKSS